MPTRPPRGQTPTSIATRGPQSLGGLQRRPPGRHSPGRQAAPYAAASADGGAGPQRGLELSGQLAPRACLIQEPRGCPCTRGPQTQGCHSHLPRLQPRAHLHVCSKQVGVTGQPLASARMKAPATITPPSEHCGHSKAPSLQGPAGCRAEWHRGGRGAQPCSGLRAGGPPTLIPLHPRAEATAAAQPSPRWAEQGRGPDAPVRQTGLRPCREGVQGALPARSPQPTPQLTSQPLRLFWSGVAGGREPRAQPRPGTRVQENLGGSAPTVPVPDGRLTGASLGPRTCKTRPRALPSPTAPRPRPRQACPRTRPAAGP